jgi:integrase
MRTIRRMTNAAIRDDHLSREDYPFEDLTLERQRTEKTSLRPDQVRSLEAQLQAAECGDAYPERDTLAMHALRGFLFQIYMLGMRWGDLATLTWSSVGPERITYSMQKNGTTKDLKIVPKAAAILESYEDRRGERRFVFPFLDRYQDDPSYNLDQENDTSRAISSRLARVNPLLKTCAQKAGIEAKVTSHVARHSFAETAMRAGWSLQEISSALGHSSVATTEDYLRTLRDDELDDKHEELF